MSDGRQKSNASGVLRMTVAGMIGAVAARGWGGERSDLIVVIILVWVAVYAIFRTL